MLKVTMVFFGIFGESDHGGAYFASAAAAAVLPKSFKEI